MRRVLMTSLFCLSSACGGAMEDTTEGAMALNTLKQRMALFDYAASSSTNNATDPNTSADAPIYLAANETVMIGTCVLNESSYTNDTFLRLYSPTGSEVALNDDYCGGLGSKISYTAPFAGDYMIRAGCYSTGLCSGTVAVARRKATTAFSTSNTNNASINTFNRQYYFNAGEYVRISTCAYNSFGATASGDTYLRLYRQSSGVYTQVAAVDNGVPNCDTSAEIFYQIPSAGYYQVRAGCAANTACSGTIAIYVE